MRPATFTEREVVAVVLTVAILKAGGRANFARDHGLAPRLVDQVLAGKCHVGHCHRMLTALGLKRVVSYERL